MYPPRQQQIIKKETFQGFGYGEQGVPPEHIEAAKQAAKTTLRSELLSTGQVRDPAALYDNALELQLEQSSSSSGVTGSRSTGGTPPDSSPGISPVRHQPATTINFVTNASNTDDDTYDYGFPDQQLPQAAGTLQFAPPLPVRNAGQARPSTPPTYATASEREEVIVKVGVDDDPSHYSVTGDVANPGALYTKTLKRQAPPANAAEPTYVAPDAAQPAIYDAAKAAQQQVRPPMATPRRSLPSPTASAVGLYLSPVAAQQEIYDKTKGLSQLLLEPNNLTLFKGLFNKSMNEMLSTFEKLEEAKQAEQASRPWYRRAKYIVPSLLGLAAIGTAVGVVLSQVFGSEKNGPTVGTTEADVANSTTTALSTTTQLLTSAVTLATTTLSSIFSSTTTSPTTTTTTTTTSKSDFISSVANSTAQAVTTESTKSTTLTPSTIQNVTTSVLQNTTLMTSSAQKQLTSTIVSSTMHTNATTSPSSPDYTTTLATTTKQALNTTTSTYLVTTTTSTGEVTSTRTSTAPTTTPITTTTIPTTTTSTTTATTASRTTPASTTSTTPVTTKTTTLTTTTTTTTATTTTTTTTTTTLTTTTTTPTTTATTTSTTTVTCPYGSCYNANCLESPTQKSCEVCHTADCCYLNPTGYC